jgi:hypothetical protein
MVVDLDEWPCFNVDREELGELMRDWDKYWPGAVESLAAVEVPEVDRG